jgi:ribosomal protein S18 acetylase RimI-like enzyme
MAMEVREVRPEEYEEAGRVCALAYREFLPPAPDEDWHGYMALLADVADRVARTTVLVAVVDGHVLGTATVELDGSVDGEVELAPNQAHLRMLGVDRAVRGRGVGRALVDACIDIARVRGRTLVTLHTTDLMHTAQHLYRSMGFERDPARDIRFDNGFLLVAYRLRLA